MENETGLGTDAIFHEPVEDIISQWKFKVDSRHDSGIPFSMFWVAGSDEKITQAIDYITEQLGIDRNAVIEFETDPYQNSVTRNLEQFADNVKLLSGNRVLMIARGFEKRRPDITDYYRYGHSWDQTIVETVTKESLGKLYRG